MDFADLVGLHLVMTKIAGKGELKVLVAGIGEWQCTTTSHAYSTVGPKTGVAEIMKKCTGAVSDLGDD